MARGQERTVSGGELSPYVQQSLGRGREVAENRLATAMSEAGATQRQGREIQAQKEMQSRQMTSEAIQQAANRAQADKRAAEVLAAQREQRIFDETMEAERRKFEVKENSLNRAHDEALAQKNWDHADKIAEQANALRRLQIRIDAKAAAANDNFQHTFLLNSQDKETAYQRAIDVDTQSVEEGERITDLYNKTRDRTFEDAKVQIGNLGIEEKKGKRVVAEDWGAYYEPVISGEKYTAPGEVLQKSISSNGSKISVEDLTPATIGNVKDKLRTGKLDAEDVRLASATLDGVIPAIDEQLKTAEGQKKILLGAFRRRVENMQANLEGLRYSKEKIEGQSFETVGSLVRVGLGPKYPAMAYSTRMMDMRNQVGGINREFMSKITQSIEPWEYHLVDIDPATMSKDEIVEAEIYNASLKSAREKYQGSSTPTNWGAD